MAKQLTVFLLYLVYTFSTVLASILANDPKLNQHDAYPCEDYNGTVKELSADIWLVHNDYSSCTAPPLHNTEDGSKVLRVSSKLSNVSINNPVVFVTRMGSQVQTWHLPLKTKNSIPYNDSSTSEHTICAHPSNNANNDTDVIMYMDVFTSNKKPVDYSFTFDIVKDFKLDIDQSISFQLAPNKPQLHYFRFDGDVSSVRVVTSSNTSKCAIVSVQNASCPVNDQLDNATSKGAYQTMISSASLVVTANKTISGRDFFIVIVSADNDTCLKRHGREIGHSHCSDDSDNDDNGHQIELVIMKLKPASSYKGAISFPFAVFLFAGIMVLLIFLCPCFTCSFVPLKVKSWFEVKVTFCRQKKQRNDETHEDIHVHVDGDDETSPMINSNTKYGSIQGSTSSSQLEAEIDDNQNHLKSPESSLEETGTFRRTLVEKEKHLKLTSLMRRDYSDLEKSYKVYGWNTITVGIFYALPAFQLVFSEQLILNADGNQDICYYNFKCVRPYGSLSAFNNVLSNIGYLIMGLAFLGIVAIRNYRANQEKRKNKQKFDDYGVPQFFGIYYAMGFGLVMEAFMSGFYHICPSDNNFQFDTAFMFIIGGLLIVKILQARHPDIQANAFVAFFCFAVVIFLTFIGIWEWSKSYWQIKFNFYILAMIFVIVFSVSYYFFHDWRVGRHWIELNTYKKIFRWFKSWCVLCNSKDKARQFLPKHPYRFFKMTLLVLANIVSCLVLVLTKNGIATVVLALFIINFLLLLLLYIICKLYYCEPITLMPIVFLIMLSICWLAAFHFYFKNVSEWEDSPAESRKCNRDCFAFKFYDHHDVWHFLSAGAMFFSFLFLMTLDDGTQLLKREEINVF